NTNANTIRLIAMELTADPSRASPDNASSLTVGAIPRPPAGRKRSELLGGSPRAPARSARHQSERSIYPKGFVIVSPVPPTFWCDWPARDHQVLRERPDCSLHPM